MRYGGRAGLVLGCIAAATAASCSAADSPPGAGADGSGGSPGSGASPATGADTGAGGTTGSGASPGTGAETGAGGTTGTGANTGSGGAVIIFDAGGGTGGTPPPPDGGVVPEELVPCETNQDCAEAIEVCDGPSTCICTISDYCGIISGPCQEQSDCQADTYCCDASCRKDQVDEPVCIPANVPPGADCVEVVNLGVFSPSVQCQWNGPGPGEPHPDSPYVLTTPIVADLAIDSGDSAEIVVITYNGTDGFVNPLQAPGKYGVLRILSGQTCELLHTIDDAANRLRASTTPALADLDGDGDIDIVARRNDRGVVAYEWNSGTFELMWSNSSGATMDISGNQVWDGVSIHDLNDDGLPEVLVRERVYNGQTGAQISDGTGNDTVTVPWYGLIPVVADLDGDSNVEILGIEAWTWVATVWEWNGADWTNEASLGTTGSHFAVADFGTAGGSFNPAALDGNAEIVVVNSEVGGAGWVSVWTLSGQELWTVSTGDRGGPPVIGDFDNDGFPEIGVAGGTRFRIFDFDCAGGGAGCESNYVRWSQPSQDASSENTGGSIFDFDGDGKAEAVYADECFLRVYEGDTGSVLFSAYRTSGTWYEGPVIADVDKDDNTEIVVNNSAAVDCPTGGGGTPYVDPIDPGVRCDDDSGCAPGASCQGNFCRCTGDEQCCLAGETLEECGLTCTTPTGESAGGGNVCRATHPNSANTVGGIRVLRDRLDRWASSRVMWNQHAYSITNINDDGSIPRTSQWQRNWTVAGLNNFRQNRQGLAGIEDLPDITGRLTDEEPCVLGQSGSIYLQATVCNRGKRAVGADLPATFYLGDPAAGNVLCTSYTDGPVPTGGCKLVYCAITAEVVGSVVTIVVNDDGHGGRATVECRPDNNTDSVLVEACEVEVPW